MDKFVLHRVPESQGLYPIGVRRSTHELLMEIKRKSGVNITELMAQIVQFCVERMEVE